MRFERRAREDPAALRAYGPDLRLGCQSFCVKQNDAFFKKSLN
jgi:hypothetical protein